MGKLEPIKLQGNYDTGQMFLHRLFGYRGVILFPWMARVYDRDMPSGAGGGAIPKQAAKPPPEPVPGPSGAPSSNGKEVKGRTHTYYQVCYTSKLELYCSIIASSFVSRQVLIDGRDCPFITHRAQTESVTFLGNHNESSRNLYAIPGLDYVAHEDILPYTTTDRNPIQVHTTFS